MKAAVTADTLRVGGYQASPPSRRAGGCLKLLVERSNRSGLTKKEI